MSEWEGGGDDSWLARASSLPGRIGLAPSFLSADLSRFRSLFRSETDYDIEDDVDDYSRQWLSTRVTPIQYGSVPVHSPVPAPDDADAITRLEVLKAPEVNFAVLSVYVAAFVALIYVVLVTRATRISWERSGALPGGYWPIVSSLIRSVLNGVFFALPIVFMLRLGMARRVASEQLWTAALLSAGLFGANPLTDWVYSLRSLGDYLPTDSSFMSRPPESHHAAHLVIYDAVYSVIVYMYLLLSIHSYRVLDPRNYSRRSFYLPKLIAACAYFCIKIALGFGFRVALGLVPFVRLLGWIFLEMSGRHSIRLTVPVLVTTFADALLCLWIIHEVSATAAFLAQVPYLETRSKQLGFRCCVYQSMLYGISSVFIAGFLVCNIPREVLYLSYDWSVGQATVRYLQLEPPVGQIALAIVYVTWNLVLAYVNLPPGPLVPYTMEGLRNLTRMLPRAFTARHRWPVWLPGSVPCEPDEDIPIEQAGSLPHDCPTENRQGEVIAYSNEQADSHRRELPRIDTMENYPDTGRTRGSHKKALVPLSYRHREWHEKMTRSSVHCNFESFMPTAAFTGKKFPSARPGRHWSDCDVLTRPLKTDFPESAVSESNNITGFDIGNSSENEASDLEQVCEDTPPPIAVPGKSATEHTWLLSAVDNAHGRNSGVDKASADESSRTDKSSSPGRLITRKNLFVMETQVILANSAYLCYIPGNREEEMPKGFGTFLPSIRSTNEITTSTMGSFAAGLDELAAQMEDERRASAGNLMIHPGLGQCSGPTRSGRDWSLEHDLGTGGEVALQMPTVQSLPDVQAAAHRPDCDDGTSFLVDPQDMASRHGLYFYRHIRHDESNGHAIVLVGQDRVVVAFSGTRDAKNWATNSKFARTPWDDMFSRFEYEPSDRDAKQEFCRRASCAEVRAASNATTSQQNNLKELCMVGDRAGNERLDLSTSRAPDASSLSRSHMHLESRNVKGTGRQSFTSPANVASHDESITLSSICRTDARGERGRIVEDIQHSVRPGIPRMLGRSRSEESLRPLSHSGDLRQHSRGSVSRCNTGKRTTEGSGAIDMAESSSTASCFHSLQSYLPLYRTRATESEHPHENLRRHARQQRGRFTRRRTDLENMALILASELATYGHAKVHRGFAIAYGKLRKRVMGALVELYGGRSFEHTRADRSQIPNVPKFLKDENGKVVGVMAGSCRGLPLFFAGHSMGGSLATFAAYEAARYYQEIGLRRRQDVACTTFGAPMSLNSVFKTRYERLVETHWRFEFAADPIPKMPGGFLNYVHVGVQVLIDQSGMILIDPSLVEVQWWGRLGNPYLGYRLHLRASYLAALKVFCARYKNGEDPMSERFWAFPIKMQTKGLFPGVDATPSQRSNLNV